MQLPVKLLSVILCFNLFGCAAAMVPYSFDPERKLGWANVLLDEQDRPLPAERLIREAVDIYQSDNDEIGLGHAYRSYAYFFRSDSIYNWQDYFREHGFLDKTANIDQRYDKSIEYYLKARAIFTKYNIYDALSSIDLGIAWASNNKKDRDMACKYLESSLANNKLFMADHPDAKIRVGNFNSFTELIASEQKNMGCS